MFSFCLHLFHWPRNPNSFYKRICRGVIGDWKSHPPCLPPPVSSSPNITSACFLLSCLFCLFSLPLLPLVFLLSHGLSFCFPLSVPPSLLHTYMSLLHTPRPTFPHASCPHLGFHFLYKSHYTSIWCKLALCPFVWETL